MDGMILQTLAQDGPSTTQLTILFGTAIAFVVALSVYLCREIILRRHTSYDSSKIDSRKDRDYEKYHSDWGEEHPSDSDDDDSLDLPAGEPNYYSVLGVKHDATNEEIKQCYRHLAKKLHPDKARSSSSIDEMALVNRAYEVLSDSEKRRLYDASL